MTKRKNINSRDLAESDFSSNNQQLCIEYSLIQGSGWVRHPSIFRKNMTWYSRNVLDMTVVKWPHISTHSPFLRDGVGNHIYFSRPDLSGYC